MDIVKDDDVENVQDTESVFNGTAVVKFADSFLSQIENDLVADETMTRSVQFNELRQLLGVVSLKRMFPYTEKYEARTRAEGLHRWYIVTYESDLPFTKVADDFIDFDGIEFVEPLRSVVRYDSFDDPWLGTQWHYFNDGSLSSDHVSGVDINVLPVWEHYTVVNDDVIVAVIDGGIDQYHEDLYENCIGGYNFVSDSHILTPHDHGTHVAGTIAAVNNNGVGVVGIAGGNHAAAKKGVSLLSCQIFQASGGDKDESVDGAPAIKWAADNGAVIAQNSWGYSFDSYREAKGTEIPQYLQDAIDYFIKYAGVDEDGRQTGPMKGGVVIFAAGNSGWDTDPIGLYPPVISVGAVGPAGTKMKYSNYGDWVDISAPGGDADSENGLIYSTLSDNNYGGLQGTSMACPHVSGVSALVVSYYGGPGFTADELKERILGGANDSFPDTRKIGPVVDALGSIVYGNRIAPDPVTDLTVKHVSGKLYFEWSVTSDEDDLKAYGYSIFVTKRIQDLQGDMHSLPLGVDRIEVMTKHLTAGDKLSAEYSKCQLGSTYYVSIVAYDRNRNVSSMSDIVTVRLPDNSPPIIELLSQIHQPVQVGAHASVELLFEIKEPDNHEYTLALKNAVSFSDLVEKEPNVYSVIIIGNAALYGVHEAVLLASDEFGATSEYVISYELLSNIPPASNNSHDDVILYALGTNIRMDLTEYFIDPDGGKLEYEFYLSDPSILAMSRNGDDVMFTPINYGITEVVVTALDSYGSSAELHFKAVVRNGSEVLAYPNPVLDFLNISVPNSVYARVRIVSQSGNVEYDKELSLDPFKNLKIDMRSFPDGIYHLSIKGENVSVENQLIKL